MDGCRPYLDGNDRVESRDGGLEWLEAQVLVGEDTELALSHTEGYTARDSRLVRTEPSVTRGVLQSQ
jgi:hypothetical protein